MMITIVHVLVLFDITDTNEAVFQYVIFQYVIRSWTWYVYKGYDTVALAVFATIQAVTRYRCREFARGLQPLRKKHHECSPDAQTHA